MEASPFLHGLPAQPTSDVAECSLEARWLTPSSSGGLETATGSKYDDLEWT